ncbi:MAG: tail fiber domain-containing protein [Muribaculaceae bacterium]|nr:tail fiber domain-containing protein [Muribaculaceae bacterium]
MRIINKLRGYSLAEIMTVLLVLTVMLAGFAPLLTKRRVTAKNTDAPWDFLDRHATYSATTNPKSHSDRNQMFFGLTPSTGDDVADIYKPLAKLVIRSGPVTGNKVQRQIQFRYGLQTPTNRTTDSGSFAGTWLMDNNKNNLLGGTYGSINLSIGSASRNTAIGYDSLSSISTASGNTAVGYRALNGVSTTRNNTSIGAYAGQTTTGEQNVYVGYGAGSSNRGSKNVIVGYKAGSGSGSAYNNTYIGAYAGQNSENSYNNVAVGVNALQKITSGHDNIALGYGALSNLQTGSNNVAVGYNACKNVTGSNKTCIGANSGPGPRDSDCSTPTNSFDKKRCDSRTQLQRGIGNFISPASDSVQRTYIGGIPYNFGGDAVLEIHNPAAGISDRNGIRKFINDNISKAPAANTTTVINGNLIVRGKTFFTSGSNLYYMHELTSAGHLFGSTSSDKCAANVTTYSLTGTSCSNVFSPLKTSDRRLKNVGLKNNSGLDKLSQLKVYNYTFKNDPDKTPQVGVIAQDLQKVFPNSVYEDKSGFLKIKWDEMLFATINAVKELDQKIVSLVKRTFKIESQLAKLEKENVLLKSQVDKLSNKVNKLKAQ